jgi:hypothetical protein
MSYAPLLRSLASTPRDSTDSWRLVFGTLMRQAWNENGKLPSMRRVLADLRSVSWGGRDADVRAAYHIMQGVFAYPPPRTSQSRTDLVSFNTPPPKSWQKTERANRDSYLSYGAIVAIDSGNVTSFLYASNTRRRPSVIMTLTEVYQAYDQGKRRVVAGPTGAEIAAAKRAHRKPPPMETEPYPETFVTLEYAGVRVLRRSR